MCIFVCLCVCVCVYLCVCLFVSRAFSELQLPPEAGARWSCRWGALAPALWVLPPPAPSRSSGSALCSRPGRMSGLPCLLCSVALLLRPERSRGYGSHREGERASETPEREPSRNQQNRGGPWTQTGRSPSPSHCVCIGGSVVRGLFKCLTVHTP